MQPPASLGAGAGGAQAVAFSSRGARLAVGFHGGDLFVLDAASCAVLGRVELRPAPSVELAWAPDGAALLASNGGAARVVVALEDGGEVQVVGPAVPADARAPGGVERAACVLGSWAVRGPPPPPPPSRTKWTRRVPHPVLIGHAASLSQGCMPKTGRATG